MRHRGTYRYIEGEKGQTKMHQVREVRNRALPDHSRETDETSEIDLMQKSEGRKASGVMTVTSHPILCTPSRVYTQPCSP